MVSKSPSLKASVDVFMRQKDIPAEMEQNLVKEALHLYLLSAMSEAGILRRTVFQGGTAIRLCYGGERYSEDLDFVCFGEMKELTDGDFNGIVSQAMETTKRSLEKEFGTEDITLKHPDGPALAGERASMAAWQIVVPIANSPRSPKSRVKIEFANVPSYDHAPRVARITPGLVQVQDVILEVETTNEILADKAVALTARATLKYRDLWDIWDLRNRLGAVADGDVVRRKFADYGVDDFLERAQRRLIELADGKTLEGFIREMSRFLPAKRVRQFDDTGLVKAIIAENVEFLRESVVDLPAAPGL